MDGKPKYISQAKIFWAYTYRYAGGVEAEPPPSTMSLEEQYNLWAAATEAHLVGPLPSPAFNTREAKNEHGVLRIHESSLTATYWQKIEDPNAPENDSERPRSPAAIHAASYFS